MVLAELRYNELMSEVGFSVPEFTVSRTRKEGVIYVQLKALDPQPKYLKP